VPSGLGAAPSLSATHEQERRCFFRIGQIVVRGARKALNQRPLVTLFARLRADGGDDDKNALLDPIVIFSRSHFGGPGEGMRECH